MLIGKTDKIIFKLAYFIMFGFELVFISFSFFPFFTSAAYRNLVLLFLTVVMEVVLVCFLLSTLQRLPYELESKCTKSLLCSTLKRKT